MKRLFFLGLALLAACTEAPEHTITNENFSIQVKQEPQGSQKTIEYKVRIFPSISPTQDLNAKMSYQTDSLFILQEGGQKKYPQQVITVSQGIKDCFEYIVSFDAENDKGQFFFNDKHISGKTYALSQK